MSMNVIQYLTSTSISKSLWILKACCVRYYWHLFSRLFEPLFLVFCFCFCYIIGPKCWPAQNDWGICCFWVTEEWSWLFLYSFLRLFDCSNGHNAGINLLDFGWIKSEIAGWLWYGRNFGIVGITKISLIESLSCQMTPSLYAGILIVIKKTVLRTFWSEHLYISTCCIESQAPNALDFMMQLWKFWLFCSSL